MKPILRHTRILTTVFMVLFFLANSGFTVAWYACTMKSDMTSRSCCKTESKDGPTSCPMSDKGNNGAATRINGNVPCLKTIVAGGLQDVSSVIQKELTSQVAKGDLVVLHAPTAVVSPGYAQSLLAEYSSASYVLPARVETYVLNSTFLI